MGIPAILTPLILTALHATLSRSIGGILTTNPIAWENRLINAD
jgi:hypothetical protein